MQQGERLLCLLRRIVLEFTTSRKLYFDPESLAVRGLDLIALRVEEGDIDTDRVYNFLLAALFLRRARRVLLVDILDLQRCALREHAFFRLRLHTDSLWSHKAERLCRHRHSNFLCRADQGCLIGTARFRAFCLPASGSFAVFNFLCRRLRQSVPAAFCSFPAGIFRRL